MKRLQNELISLVNRGADRHLRLAVTGLSSSGKTAFITSLVNQLLNLHSGAHLPLFSAVREERLHGVKRIAQRDLAISRFTYDEGIRQLYGQSPVWPTPTRSVSEIRLMLRFRSRQSIWRHFQPLSTLYLEIVDYPGEWLLDLPMLDHDYLSWSQQMMSLLQGERAKWGSRWLELCQQLNPLALADENQLALIALAWTEWLYMCKQQGMYFIQPGRFILPGEMAGAPVLQFFPWPRLGEVSAAALAQAPANSNLGMLRDRYNYYCHHVVHRFYKNHFLHFDRQIVLVDCLQSLNCGAQTFSDLRLALSQLMRSFSYGQRTLFRRLFSPVIDKLLFAATKADHVTTDQHASLVSLLTQLVQDSRQHAAFEGIAIECIGLASVQATENGQITHNGSKIAALRGNRLCDNASVTLYPGDVPARLPDEEFWQNQGFQFEEFRPPVLALDRPLPHIRMDAALEFLLGDKLR